MSQYDQSPLQEAIQVSTPETTSVAEAASESSTSSNALTELTNQASSALSSVYSSSNISDAVTSSDSTPDYSDPLALYDYYMNSSDITNTRSEVQSIQEQINSLNETLQNTLLAYKNKTMGLNAIRGAQEAASDTAALPLEALSSQLTAKNSYLSTLLTEASNKYSIAKEQRNLITSLISSTNGKAGISYTDTYEEALEKVQEYEEEQEKKEYKKALKQTAMELGISTSGLSANEIEKKLEKYYKSQKEYKSKIQELELAAKQKSSTSSSSSYSDEELLAYADMISQGMGSKVPTKAYADAWSLLSDDEKANISIGL